MVKPSLDQERAKHAWEAVIRFRLPNGGYGADAKEYATEAKKLPMRIMSAGLGSALAFVSAKAKKKKKHLISLNDDLTDWVIKERKIAARNPKSLLESIIYGQSDFLRQATEETLAYLQWLNRFAEAEGLTDEENGN